MSITENIARFLRGLFGRLKKAESDLLDDLDTSEKNYPASLEDPGVGADAEIRLQHYDFKEKNNDEPNNKQARAQAGSEPGNVKRLLLRLAFLEGLIDTLPTPIFAKTAKGRFCLINKAYEHFFGVSRQDILGRKALHLAHLGDEAERKRLEQEHVAIVRGQVRNYETEYETIHGRRQVMYWSGGFGDQAEHTWAQAGLIVDISEMALLQENLASKVSKLQRVEQKLRYMSRSDPLTGLANRRPFVEYLALGVDLARRKQIPMCMLMVDIDHFKHINDTYGHDLGDMVLRALAGMLRSSCRSKDLAARIGGEEFVVLFAATELNDALVVAERIRKNIGDTPLLPDGAHVTVSVGVAQYNASEGPRDFIRRVDAAMYKAKQGGRNQVRCSK